VKSPAIDFQCNCQRTMVNDQEKLVMKNILKLIWNFEESRLRAAYRVFLEIIAYFLVSLVLKKSLQQVIDLPEYLDGSTPLWFILVLTCIRMGRIGTVWLAAKYLDKRLISDFGMLFNKEWFIELMFGLLLGAVAMTGIFLVELAMGWVTISETLHVGLADRSFVAGMFSFFILLFIVGISEELFYRAYILQNFAEGLNFRNKPVHAVLYAVLVSSIIFGLTHALNDNATFTSTINIMLGGIFLSVGYILTGRLAISIGLHTTWNFFQGNIFGFAVSGNAFLKDSVSLIEIEQSGPTVWTGGPFGPEAGISGLIAMLVITLTVIGWIYIRTGRIKIYSPLAVAPNKSAYPLTIDS